MRDTEKKELRLPEGRLAKLKGELEFWKGKSKATEKQLQVLVGHLSHCARIIKEGKLYMHYLFKKLKEAKGKRRVKLDANSIRIYYGGTCSLSILILSPSAM